MTSSLQRHDTIRKTDSTPKLELRRVDDIVGLLSDAITIPRKVGPRSIPPNNRQSRHPRRARMTVLQGTFIVAIDIAAAANIILSIILPNRT